MINKKNSKVNILNKFDNKDKTDVLNASDIIKLTTEGAFAVILYKTIDFYVCATISQKDDSRRTTFSLENTIFQDRNNWFIKLNYIYCKPINKILKIDKVGQLNNKDHKEIKKSLITLIDK